MTFVVVMSHLEPSSSETTFNVEPLVGLAAIENSLVASDVCGNVIESLNHTQTQLLSLLVFRDGNIFDVASLAERVNAIIVSASVE